MSDADKPTCLACRFFAGRARDRLATLFRQRKGYCDHPKHPWGIWNVVQEITNGSCPLFEDATDQIKEQRRIALRKLSEKNGRKVLPKSRI